MSFTHLDLFAGIGGFSLSARWMGWETLAWCEWNEFCQKVLRYHFPDAEGFGDITKTDFTKYANRIDVLTGGFPCQPFSVAGNRKGKEDLRYLWPEMLRAIKEVRPTWVVAENVYGIINQGKGMVFQQVHTDLENEGYQVQPYILPACSVGAPHKRERVWFVAYSDQNRKMVQRGNGNCNDKKRNGKEKVQERKNKQFGFKQSGTEIYTNTKSERGFRLSFGKESEHAKFTFNGSNESIANTERIRQQGQGWPEGQSNSKENRDWEASWTYPNDRWPTQSALRSGNDGIPNGLAEYPISKKDYLKFSLEGIGNAIVPQVAYEIFKTIQEYEDLKL